MSTVFLLVPLAAPVLTAAVYLLAGWRSTTVWVGVGSAVAVLAASIGVAVSVVETGPFTAMAGFVRADGLSAFMLLVIGAVSVLTTAATPNYFEVEIEARRATARTAARHSLLVQVFLAAMALTVVAADLGVLWVAIEATTIVTAFLVGQRRTRTAVEAAWKYVVICSAGIALALLGTVILNFASSQAGAGGLNMAALADHASDLDPAVTRMAVVLLILGFGAKAGLAPLHAWLPDAHSEAPAPVSALMSGVLLSVAFYAILRVKIIADHALGAEFARGILAVIALATLLVSALLLLTQRDYRRMLAYSSIEHLALVALGAAIGSRLAVAAALLHILGHGLVKGVLFLAAGHILQETRTSQIDEIRGLASRFPVLAAFFGLGVLALIGLPPFSLFASELGIARAGFASTLNWVTAAALVLVLIIAAALLTHVSRMLLGTPKGDGKSSVSTGVAIRVRTGTIAAAAMAGGLAVSAVIGVAAGPLAPVLHLAADTITRN